MVGKKKTEDVQFSTEVGEAVQTLDGGRRSMYDPDEIEEEQRERDVRNKVCPSGVACECTYAFSVFEQMIASQRCIVSRIWRAVINIQLICKRKLDCRLLTALTGGGVQVEIFRTVVCVWRSIVLFRMVGCISGRPSSITQIAATMQINRHFQRYVKHVHADIWEKHYR